MLFDPKIVVSGAAAGEAAETGEHFGYQVGKQVAIHGGIVVTGATSGVPYAAARGAKSVHGQVIGFSPANSILEHTKKYRLPIQHHDFIFFTGYDYAGRDTVLVDFADAVIEVSGRIGTLHEFTHAFERNKVIGILSGSGGIIDDIPLLMEKAHRGHGRVVINDDPKELVRMVIKELEDLHGRA
ncbi:MAG TPA: hypothetical protein VLA04_01730 [Verrucomicrobiae bacterium]|nr:hypothetical protein [Verrucomicrobiae bacterium]